MTSVQTKRTRLLCVSICVLSASFCSCCNECADAFFACINSDLVLMNRVRIKTLSRLGV